MQYGNIVRNTSAPAFARNKSVNGGSAKAPIGDHTLSSDHREVSTKLSPGDQCRYVLSGANGQSSTQLQKMLDALTDVEL
jgi:hypothetical protein